METDLNGESLSGGHPVHRTSFRSHFVCRKVTVTGNVPRLCSVTVTGNIPRLRSVTVTGNVPRLCSVTVTGNVPRLCSVTVKMEILKAENFK